MITLYSYGTLLAEKNTDPLVHDVVLKIKEFYFHQPTHLCTFLVVLLGKNESNIYHFATYQQTNTIVYVTYFRTILRLRIHIIHSEPGKTDE